MARPKGIKNHSQFCINGHDLLIVGKFDDGHCKECRKEYREQNKEKIAKQQKDWRKEHKEEIAEYMKAYFKTYNEEDKEILREYHKKWYLKNIKQIKLYREQNKEEIAKRNKKWRDTHKEQLKEYMEEYYQNNRERLDKQNKEWANKHPEVHRLKNLKGKTNRGLRAKISFGQEGIKEFIRNTPANMTVDHYIPLCGDYVSGFNVIWNLQYLTKSQNSKKKNKANLFEISEWYGKILEEAGLK